jgi:antitoxin (DNA-binding transcriptional repressor) of toxin-antitoxin stability system
MTHRAERKRHVLDPGDRPTYVTAMATHVNIGEAESRLSELVAAAIRGEDIILDSAGRPQVRLVPIPAMTDSNVERRAQNRRQALGMFREEAAGLDIDVKALKAERVDADDRSARYSAPSS